MNHAPIWRIYLFQWLVCFAPIAVLYMVLFDKQGLSTIEISILVTAWSISSIALEVPSGVLADRHDRRKVLAIGQTLVAASFIAWWIVPNFWTFLFGFILWGAGSAFYSGTFEALVYDELKSTNNSDKYLSVLGKTEFFYLFSVVASSLLAALLVEEGFHLVFLVSIVTSAASAVVALTLHHTPPQEAVGGEKYLATLKRGIKQGGSNPLLFRAIALVASFGTVVDLTTEYGPLFFIEEDFAASWIAVIIAMLVLAMALASWFAERLSFLAKYEGILMLLSATSLFGATLLKGFPAVALYGVACVLPQMGWVFARNVLQESIEGDLRATATSLAGFSQEVINVVCLLGFGVIATAFSRLIAFQSLAFIILVMAVAVVWAQRFKAQIVPRGSLPD